ncbi:MAG: MOSC N-terminal beta barrel domain-containing protein [Rhizobacter sp.]
MTLVGLNVYPIKSCGGVSVQEALLIETGLEFDRAWMVVDAQGMFVTQRELPRMALIQPTLKHTEVVLRAPGMLALHLAIDAVEGPVRVKIWKDEVAAYDMGDLAAQWFSDFLGQPSAPGRPKPTTPPRGGDAEGISGARFPFRLVRFDPEQKRLSNKKWTGELDAENAFSDGFPILVASEASLAGLNERLAARGIDAITMARFRPNLVLSGLEAHGEDHLDEIRFDTPEGPVCLKLVKPCTRCPIPNVNPLSGETGHEPGDTLSSYRTDPRLDGAVTFAMNAVIVSGIDCGLRVGQAGRASYRFE